VKRVFKCRKGKNRMAVDIAADALWQLEHGKIEPAHVYVRGSFDNGSEVRSKRDLNGCEVCAIGSLLVGRLRRFDTGWINYPDGKVAPSCGFDVRDKLVDVFNSSLLREIEDVYERFYMTSASDFEPWIEIARDSNGWDRGDKDRQVMAAILRNIIANNGNFKPSSGIHREVSVKLNAKRKVVVVRKKNVRNKLRGRKKVAVRA